MVEVRGNPLYPGWIGLWTYPWDWNVPASKISPYPWLHVQEISVAMSYHRAKLYVPREGKRWQWVDDGVLFVPKSQNYVELLPIPHSLIGRPPLSEVLETIRMCGEWISAWIVLLHNRRLGQTHPEYAAVTAFGDVMYDHLCPSQLPVRTYMSALIQDTMTQGPWDAINVEAWRYADVTTGMDRLVTGVAWTLELRELLSVCFCTACQELGYGAGSMPDAVRKTVQQRISILDDALPDVVRQPLPDDVQRYLSPREQIITHWLRTITTLTRLPIRIFTEPLDNPEVFGINWQALSRISNLSLILAAYGEYNATHNVLQKTVKEWDDPTRLSFSVRYGFPDSPTPEATIERVINLRKLRPQGLYLYHFSQVSLRRLEDTLDALSLIMRGGP